MPLLSSRGHSPHLTVTASICMLLALAGCSEDTEPAQVPPRVAFVEPLQRIDNGPEVLRFPGVVDSVTSTQLAFQVPGRVERILVDEGERVEKGQPVAKLDDTDYELQLREAEARLRQLEADLTRKRALLAEGILAPAAVEPLQANVVAAQVARDSALRNVNYSTLEAPFDGVIARRLVEPDMVVATGSPVLELQNNQHIEVAVDLPESAALSIPLNSTLEAVGELVVANLTLPLAYKEHSTQPREGSRTYNLTLQGEPPAGYNLLPGMAMRVRLQRPAASPSDTPPRFRLPLNAVQTAPNGSHYLWLAVDGHAQRLDLQLEHIENDHAVVSGELNNDMLVVVAGGSKLSEDQPIKAERRK
ncbi:efflux RND transporter periplasmic adaptor subunit [Stutzerimonas stutzeri]|uniref:efflux RND transporter periplasmic adaptor subunit n=1 Tax=Stutzerimonas stutzeri TaxID=316 RepID=UPI0021092FE0|nr:efflux RND transporter periplasmic adaptor subunit [Stutzerimonas stutzeri]MCQ4320904.1 efflux RND transporter periplasmic adaptor subunit [Stutzerimonas stutzeri]